MQALELLHSEFDIDLLLDAVGRLPKARQRFVTDMLDTVLAGQAG